MCRFQILINITSTVKRIWLIYAHLLSSLIYQSKPISALPILFGWIVTFYCAPKLKPGNINIASRKSLLLRAICSVQIFLDIPGEDLPHVDHYFFDPHRYFRKRLLIVGGRNSAVKAALRCWRSGAEVALSYRCAEFDSTSVKHFILPDLLTQIELGTIQFLPETVPVAITPAHVVLAGPDNTQIQQPADFVLMLTGIVGDMSIFEHAGVTLVGAGRAPQHNSETMETNVPGLYVAGTAVGGERNARYSFFIENCHVHVERIVQHITGNWPDKLGTIPARCYELPLDDIQAN